MPPPRSTRETADLARPWGGVPGEPASPSSGMRVPFRARFEPEVWARLCRHGRVREVMAGEVLLRRGSRCTTVIVPESGSLDVVDPRTSPETVLELLEPGDIAGEMSFVDGAAASAEIRARAAGTCRFWAHDTLRRELEADPELALLFYTALSATIVARVRTITTSAMIGGFGGGIDPVAGEVERAALSLAERLLGAHESHRESRAAEVQPKEHREDREGARQLEEALVSAARWFARAAPARATAVGERLRAVVHPVLSASPLAAMLLGRRAEARSYVSRGQTGSADRLDQALLRLPTLRGWRWRDGEVVSRLSRAVEARAHDPRARPAVMVITLDHQPHSPALLAATSRARLTTVTLSRSPGALAVPSAAAVGPDPAIIAVSPMVFLRGQEPAVPAYQDVVIFDGPTDHLPDLLVAAILRWAARHLRSGGKVILGYASPSEDADLLEHLFAWPTLPRRSQAAMTLLPSGGHHRSLAHQGDAAARVLTWMAP